MGSTVKYQFVLDAREIKHFLDARAKGITTSITGRKKQSDEGAALFTVRVHAIVMPIIPLSLSFALMQIYDLLF